ncbi:hypothetical protein BDF20DRAFT_807215, partial [Mycotypha africana]|uniref:uncharacterized protein n=1 Tax=Mycotypha africana TaxID=64632 RepID=UPI002300EBDC
MDKILIDYDKNLEELERQREKLEIVMQVMGQEWEVSGAGIGWLGQIDPVVNTSIEDTRPLFSKMLAAQASPSPEYLQSLLNVNEALLAQSLANNDEHSSTPMPSPIDKKNDN